MRRGSEKRCLHLCTSLAFTLDLLEAQSQRQQMVVAYAVLALTPWGAGSEKLFALRHRSVSCFPLLLSNPECTTWGLLLCPGISVWKEIQCAESYSFFWSYKKPLQHSMGIPLSSVKSRSLDQLPAAIVRLCAVFFLCYSCEHQHTRQI